jgi:hypothetical protein
MGALLPQFDVIRFCLVGGVIVLGRGLEGHPVDGISIVMEYKLGERTEHWLWLFYHILRAANQVFLGVDLVKRSQFVVSGGCASRLSIEQGNWRGCWSFGHLHA